jgi:hypothetical protein
MTKMRRMELARKHTYKRWDYPVNGDVLDGY